jgi:hypothetical protein
MLSGAMIYITSFIKLGSSIETFICGDTQTHRQQGDHISLVLFLFFKIRKVGKKQQPFIFQRWIL